MVTNFNKKISDGFKAVFVVLALANFVYAFDGDIDPAFNSGAVKIVNKIGTISYGPYGFALQSDNKILLPNDIDNTGGSTNRHFSILRLNVDGTPDATYDATSVASYGDSVNDGILVDTSLTPSESRIAITSDGSSIIVFKNLLYKYSASGARDSTFNANFPNTSMTGDVRNGNVAFDSAGSIYHVSYVYNANTIYLAKYDANGTVDTNFNSGNVITIPFNYSTGHSSPSVKVDSQDRVVIAAIGTDSASVAKVWRYTSSGALDGSFSVDSSAHLSNYVPDASYEPFSIGIDTNDNIFIPMTQNAYNSYIVKVDANLSSVVFAIYQAGGGFRHALIDADDKILVGGQDASNFRIYKYNINGTLDTTFGAAGLATVAVTTPRISGLALDSNNNLVIGGSSASNFAAVRLLNSVSQPPKLAIQAHGGVVQFDGNSSISVSGAGFNLVNDFTFETWVYWNGRDTSTDQSLLSFGDGATKGISLVLKRNGTNDYTFGVSTDGTVTSTTVSGFSLIANTWYHIAFKREAGNRRFFINGSEVSATGSLTTSFTGTASTDNLTIGRYGDGSRYFTGIIDEVRVWSVARTSAEINSTMNHQLDGNENGLHAYYNFDERIGNLVYDITPNARNANIVGSIARLNFLGDGLEFDGVDDGVDLGDDNIESLSAYSSGAWIKLKGDRNDRRTILSKNWTVAFNINTSGAIDFNIGNGSNTFNSGCTGTEVLDLDKWYYVVTTYEYISSNGVVNIYLNGNLDKTCSTGFTTPMGDGNYSREIGVQNNSFRMNGTIAEVTMWNKALTPAEVNATMNYSVNGSESGLVGYWAINEGFGGSVFDKTSNSNNGAIGGATWIDNSPKIYGNKIYTSNDVITKTKFELLNSSSTNTTYAFSGSVPSHINFDGTNGVFEHKGIFGEESYAISANDNGDIYNLDLKIRNYVPNSFTVSLQNLNMQDSNITKISLIGQNGIDVNISLISLNGIDWYESISQEGNYSLKIEMTKIDENLTWYYNFDDGKLYSNSDYNSSFNIYINNFGSTLDIDVDNSNFIFNLFSGLVAFYDFTDGLKNDKTSNGNDGGTTAAITTTDRFGNSNGAYLFSSLTEDNISIANINLPRGSDKYTLSAWFKSATPGGTLVSLGSFQSGIRHVSSLTLSASNSISSVWNGDDFQASANGITNIYDNKWHQAITTYDGEYRKIYIDGVLIGANYDGIDILAVDQIAGTLGATQGASLELNGSLDDVKIFNRALSSVEIKALYESDKPAIKFFNILGTGVRDLVLKYGYTYTADNTFYAVDITDNSGVCLSGRTTNDHYTSYVDMFGNLVWNDTAHGGDAYSVSTDGNACYSIGWGGPIKKYNGGLDSITTFSTDGYNIDTDSAGNSYVLINGGGVKRLKSDMVTTDWAFYAHTYLSLNDAISSHVLYNDGFVYIVGVDWNTRQEGFIFKLDALTGAVDWNVSFVQAQNAQDAKIAISDNRIFVTASNNSTYIYNKQSGNLVSTKNYLGNIVAIGDSVIVNSAGSVKILDENLNLIKDLNISDYPEKIRASGLVSSVDNKNINVYDINHSGTTLKDLNQEHNYSIELFASGIIDVSIVSSNSTIVGVNDSFYTLNLNDYTLVNIPFSLSAKQIGNTQVTITLSNGIDTFIKVIDVDVKLYPKFLLQAHGGVVQFDSNSSLIQLANGDFSQNDNLTLEAWVNWRGIDTSSYQNIVYIGDGTTNGIGLQLKRVGANDYRLSAVTEGAVTYTYDNNLFDSNTWHHVAFVRDNGTRKLYIDGVNITVAGDVVTTFNAPLSTDSITIGNYPNSSKPFKGMIDEVRVWSVARTSAEINSTMNHQLDGNENGLHAYYNFDERIGNLVYDITPNARNANIVGSIGRLNFLGKNLTFHGNGSGDSVVTSAIDFSGPQLSIGAWIKSSDTINLQEIVKNSLLNFILRIENNSLKFIVSPDDTNISANTLSYLFNSNDFLNKWRYVSVSYDNNGTNTIVKMFIDGSLVVSNLNWPSNNINFTNTESFSIGSNNGSNLEFNGSIAEVSIWNKVLKDTHFKRVMARSLSSSEDGLVAYWPLNEGSGASAYNKVLQNYASISQASWNDTAPTIYGNKIYTTKHIGSSNKLYFENNSTQPSYSLLNEYRNISFDSNYASFYLSPINSNDVFSINADDNGFTYTLDVNVRAYDYTPVIHSVTNNSEYGEGSIKNAIFNSLDGDIVDLTTLLGLIIVDSPINIYNSIKIIGAGSEVLKVSGGENSQIFNISPNAIVSIENISISDGYISENPGAGISNQGELSLKNVSMKNNYADISAGGAIYNIGLLKISDSNISNNIAYEGPGGAIYSAGYLEIYNSNIFENNSTNAAGGAISINGGVFKIHNSSIYKNFAQLVGSIYVESPYFPVPSGGAISVEDWDDDLGASEIVNTIIYGNGAYNGGGIYNSYGEIFVSNSTIAFNGSGQSFGDGICADSPVFCNTQTECETNSYVWDVSTNSCSPYSQNDPCYPNGCSGGGIFNDTDSILNLLNSIIADNNDSNNHGTDCYGQINSYDNNFITNTTDCSISGGIGNSILDQSSDLVFKYENNLLTYTFGMESGIYDGGTCNSFNAQAVTTDRFFNPRPIDNSCDIGAIERALSTQNIDLNITLKDLNIQENNITEITLIDLRADENITITNQYGFYNNESILFPNINFVQGGDRAFAIMLKTVDNVLWLYADKNVSNQWYFIDPYIHQYLIDLNNTNIDLNLSSQNWSDYVIQPTTQNIDLNITLKDLNIQENNITEITLIDLRADENITITNQYGFYNNESILFPNINFVQGGDRAFAIMLKTVDNVLWLYADKNVSNQWYFIDPYIHQYLIDLNNTNIDLNLSSQNWSDYVIQPTTQNIDLNITLKDLNIQENNITEITLIDLRADENITITNQYGFYNNESILFPNINFVQGGDRAFAIMLKTVDNVLWLYADKNVSNQWYFIDPYIHQYLIDLNNTNIDLNLSSQNWSDYVEYSNMEVNQTVIDFGLVKLGEYVTTQIEISNNGIGDLYFDSISLSDFTDFNLTSNCSNFITTNAMCNVYITFIPTSDGNKTSTLSIRSNSQNGYEHNVSMSGYGDSIVDFSLSINNLDLNLNSVVDVVLVDVDTNLTYSILNTTLNNGTTNLQKDLNLLGKTFFMRIDTSESGVGSSWWYDFIDLKIYEDYRLLNANYTLTFDSTRKDVVLDLNSTNFIDAVYLDAPLSFSNNTISFGYMKVDSSQELNITITNTNLSMIEIDLIEIIGGNNKEFNISNPNCSTLDVNASCQITLTFIPTYAGIKTSQLSIGIKTPFIVPATISLDGYAISSNAYFTISGRFAFDSNNDNNGSKLTLFANSRYMTNKQSYLIESNVSYIDYSLGVFNPNGEIMQIGYELDGNYSDKIVSTGYVGESKIEISSDYSKQFDIHSDITDLNITPLYGDSFVYGTFSYPNEITTQDIYLHLYAIGKNSNFRTHKKYKLDSNRSDILFNLPLFTEAEVTYNVGYVLNNNSLLDGYYHSAHYYLGENENNSSKSASSDITSLFANDNVNANFSLLEIDSNETVVKINDGWNMFSFATSQTLTKEQIKEIFKAYDGVKYLAKYDQLFNEWVYFWIDEESYLPQYNTFTEIEPNDGLLLYAELSNSFNMQIFSQDKSVFSNAYEVSTGFNLLGVKESINASDFVSKLQNESGKSVEVMWKIVDGVWSIYLNIANTTSPYPTFSTLKKGDSVWVKMY